MTTTTLAPSHPGEILAEDLADAGISQRRLAAAIGVVHTRINEIVNGTRPITADTALRLARYFGTSAEYWMNLQMRYDLDIASDAITAEVGSIVPREAA